MAFGGERWTNKNLTETESTLLNWIGKEKDNESKLGDHGVRKFEYETGRFISIDPLWAKYYGWSPYQYSMNSPVDWQDGNGLLKIAAEGTKIYSDYDDNDKQINNYKNYPVYVYDLQNAIIPYIRASGILKRMLEVTHVSENTILKDMEFGSGPEIYINSIYEKYDEFDRRQKDGKFEMGLGISSIGEDPNNYYGSGTNLSRLWRLMVTIHGYLHDRFDLTHPQIYYILGGDNRNHPIPADIQKQMDNGDLHEKEYLESSKKINDAKKSKTQ